MCNVKFYNSFLKCRAGWLPANLIGVVRRCRMPESARHVTLLLGRNIWRLAPAAAPGNRLQFGLFAQ